MLWRDVLAVSRMTVNDGSEMSWYYCLVHQRVEPDEGCANAERLGPYDTEAAG